MHVHYRPAMHVLDKLAQVDFVAVIGPTAVGKTTLIKTAMKQEPALHKVLNNTSRSPRPGESDGVDFRFLPKESMQEQIKNGQYVQVAPTVLGDLYATAPEDYSTTGVAMLEVLAEALPNFRSLPFKSVRAVYVLPPSWDEWYRRLTGRSFNPEQLKKRLAEAKHSLKFAHTDPQMQFIINDDLHQAAEDFISLALDRPASDRLRTAQPQARKLNSHFLAKLK